jgi:hypothetical protein
MIERLVLLLNSTCAIVPRSYGLVSHAMATLYQPNSAPSPDCSMRLLPQPIGLALRDEAVASVLA